MIPEYLSPLANHLWQSTLVVAAAALLVRILRTYTPTPFSAATLAQRGGAPMPGVDPDGPSLFNAIEEQLGLKLQPKKMPVPVLVIDHIEPLAEN
jgi:uncharacterized protein (TIGR03435 family)